MNILSQKTYICLFLGGLVTTYLLVPLVEKLALRAEAVDHPSDRRVHEDRTPTLGGLAVALPVYAGIFLLYLWPNAISQEFFADSAAVAALLVGGALMLAVGVYDDLRGADATLKLGSQALAAMCVCALSGWITSLNVPLIGSVDLGLAAVPITILWIVAVTNAFNLIDGIDGLASGVGFLVCAASFFIANAYGRVTMMVFATVMGGSLLAFLRYNFHPARIFLGDTGSLFVGFTIAVVSLHSSMKTSTAALLLIPVCAVGYPLMDMSLTVVRRLLKGKPLFSSDRGHIHHKLLASGLGPRVSSLVAYGLTFLFTAVAILEVYGRHRESGIVLGLLLVIMVVLFRAFGYWRYFSQRLDFALRREFRIYHLVAKTASLKMRDADDLDELWASLCQVGSEFNLHAMSLHMNGTVEKTWRNRGVDGDPEGTVRQFRLSNADAVLKISHNGRKDEDIELEQNILLEQIGEDLAKNLERMEAVL